MADQKSIFQVPTAQDLEGPFSQFLGPPPPQPRQGGTTSRAGAVAAIVTPFLQGAAKARQQQFEQKENEKIKNINMLSQWWQSRRKGLLPEGQEKLDTLFNQAMFGYTLGEFEGKGKGGKGGKGKQGEEGQKQGLPHVFGNILKEVALGAVGGKMPKGAPDMDPHLVMGQLEAQIASNPQWSEKGQQGSVANAYNKALQGVDSAEGAARVSTQHWNDLTRAFGQQGAKDFVNMATSGFMQEGTPQWYAAKFNKSIQSKQQQAPPSAGGEAGLPTNQAPQLTGDELAAGIAGGQIKQHQIEYNGERQIGYHATMPGNGGVFWYSVDKNNQPVRLDPSKVSLAGIGAERYMKEIWGYVEGSSEPRRFLSEDREGGKIIDSLTKKPVDPDKVKLLPPGVLSARERGLYMNAYGALFQSELGKIESDPKLKNLDYEQKKLMARAKASALFYEKHHLQLELMDQNIAINAILSGEGRQTTTRTATPPVPGEQKNTKPKTQQAPPNHQDAKPKAATPTGPPPNQKEGQKKPTEREARLMGMYISSVTGTAKQGGRAAQAGEITGKQMLRERTGLDYGSLDSEIAIYADRQQSMKRLTEQTASLGRISEVIQAIGKLTASDADKILTTRSPLLTQYAREIELKAVGDPNLRAYLVAWNDIQREYGRLSAGGLSRANLPVNTTKEVGSILDPNMTAAEAVRSIQRLKETADAEKEATNKEMKNIQGELRESPIGQALSATAPATQSPPTPARPEIRTSEQDKKAAEEYIKKHNLRPAVQ